MKILILENNEYQPIKENPIVGRFYTLEDAETGTAAQNKAFHSLVQEWFKSGCHSYECKSWTELKGFVKRDIGAGFESYRYVESGKIKKCEKVDEIPITATDKQGVLKSWTVYTKKERKKTLDMLISTMIQSGVQTKKFNEIMDGLEKLEGRL